MLQKEQQSSKVVWAHKKRTTGVKPVGNSIIALARQGQELPVRKGSSFCLSHPASLSGTPMRH